MLYSCLIITRLQPTFAPQVQALWPQGPEMDTCNNPFQTLLNFLRASKCWIPLSNHSLFTWRLTTMELMNWICTMSSQVLIQQAWLLMHLSPSNRPTRLSLETFCFLLLSQQLSCLLLVVQSVKGLMVKQICLIKRRSLRNTSSLVLAQTCSLELKFLSSRKELSLFLWFNLSLLEHLILTTISISSKQSKTAKQEFMGSTILRKLSKFLVEGLEQAVLMLEL